MLNKSVLKDLNSNFLLIILIFEACTEKVSILSNNLKLKIMNLKFTINSLIMAIALLVSAGCTTENGGVMNHPM